MNKELKFRAWDKDTEQMIVIGFHILGEVNCFGLIEGWLRENNPCGKPLLERLNDIVIQQYTGIKDKHGREIYEGDIIITSYKPDQSFEVKFINGAFTVNDAWLNCFLDIEIVGNIFENPNYEIN